MGFAKRGVFTVKRSTESVRNLASDGLKRTPFGALLLCVACGCLLLAACNKGISNWKSNAPATVEANVEERQAAQRRKAESLYNLKQIAVAFHHYHDTYRTFPAAVQIGPKDVPHSWRVTILPFIEQGELYGRYHQDEPWDSDHNKALLGEIPAVLRAPGTASNSANAGYFGFMPPNPSDDPQNNSAPAVSGTRPSRLRDIIDGTSNTILVVESQLDVPSTQPIDIPFGVGEPPPAMGGIHNDGFYAAMCDGKAIFVADAFDRSMLLKLILYADGEKVDLPNARHWVIDPAPQTSNDLKTRATPRQRDCAPNYDSNDLTVGLATILL